MGNRRTDSYVGSLLQERAASEGDSEATGMVSMLAEPPR